MEYEREYYKNFNTYPLIFYVIFGVKGNELTISKERHHVENIPEGLNIRLLTKDKNKEYMESLIGHTIGDVLKKDNFELYERIKETNEWAIINGDIVDDSNLNYMRDTIGIIQAFIETGAIGVLDLQTFSLYSSEKWTNEIFIPKFNPCSHVKILISDIEDDKNWIHTRGLRKFGRPDISLMNVKTSNVDDAFDIINQMIYYSSKGTLFDKESKLHTPKNKSFIIKPSLIEDYENPDFNNAYYKIEWEECEQEE